MLGLLVLASLVPPAGAGAEPATLTGVVQTDAGRPVPGASVFIRTAGPRKGVGDL
jgi:hypothetical protein